MEANKSHCPDCGVTYFWTGLKTGFGKTQIQLDQMKRSNTVCRECGSTKLKTGLDCESEIGKSFQESSDFAVSLIGGFIGGFTNGKKD